VVGIAVVGLVIAAVFWLLRLLARGSGQDDEVAGDKLREGAS
jgi:hypothetical protein